LLTFIIFSKNALRDKKVNLLIDWPIILSESEESVNFDASQLLLSQPRDGSPVYVSLPPCLLIVTLKPDIRLEDLTEGAVVDATIDWHPKQKEKWVDERHAPFVLTENIGKRHFRLTIWGVAQGGEWDKKLSEIIESAPRSDRPGGYRGTQGRKAGESTTVVGLRLNARQLEIFHQLGGQKHVYEYLDKMAEGFSMQ
jgi:hypothetical protein